MLVIEDEMLRVYRNLCHAGGGDAARRHDTWNSLLKVNIMRKVHLAVW